MAQRPENSHLEKIKGVAKALVYLDIGETKFSPVVVKHPFTDTGFTLSPMTHQIVDLMKDKDGLANWQRELVKVIDSSECAGDLLYMITKSYRFAYLKLIEDYLSLVDLSILVRDTWVGCENPSTNQTYTKSALVRLFKRCQPAIMMSSSDLEVFDNLPDEIRIYRGIGKVENPKIRARHVKSLSWSTRVEVAQRFAERRIGGTGEVYQAIISKKDVLAFFDDRGESEVVVDPSKLQRVELLKI